MATHLPSPPATAPDRDTQDGDTFSANVAAFLAWVLSLFSVLNTWVDELMQLTSAAITGTSASSVAIGTGSKSFTASTGRAWIGGQNLRIVDSANSANYMLGTVTSYNSGTGALVVNVTDTGGSGTKTAWSISLEISADLSAKLDVTGGTATDLTVTGYQETTIDPSAGTSFSPDLSTGTMFNYDTSNNATITLPTAEVGQSFAVEVTYGATHTLTFAGEAVKWKRGSPPDPTSTNGATDGYAFSCFEAGVWTGYDTGRDMS